MTVRPPQLVVWLVLLCLPARLLNGALVRQANTSLQLPSSPPPTTYALVNAFPGLSFSQPVALATPPGEKERLFVSEKTGRLQLVPDVTAATPQKQMFLDLRTLVNSRPNEQWYDSGEAGLLGLAFHPGHVTNRQFFVFYTAWVGGALYDRVSRFEVSAGNTNTADTASEVILLQQPDEASNHNGGDIHFGPDGYLYVALGDEGGGNDQFNNSQKIDQDFFAGILRIDVDRKPGSRLPADHPAVVTHNGAAVSAGGVPNYGIPPDNPWVNATTFNGVAINSSARREEFWAVGLRNPWRFSFDPQTYEMYIADVGQSSREEINIGAAGANYGWDIHEASLQRSTPPNGMIHTLPIYEYSRGSGTFQGNSVTGGIVYYGNRHPELQGRYLFADYVSGNLWSMDRESGVQVERLLGEGGIVTFGYDPSNGDVLVGDYNNAVVRRLIKRTSAETFPVRLSQTGVFSDLAALTPEPGVVPYEPNVSFWSDQAIKTRWFSVPNPADTIAFNATGNWGFPIGSVWVKHFELELTRGDPSSRTRVETRVLVQSSNGVYGVSYKWNAQGTDADLVEDAGENLSYQIIDEYGTNRVQNWRIPGRAECLSCHTAVGGGVLSFNTPQLSGIGPIGNSDQDRIQALNDAGYFTLPVTSTSGLARYSKKDDASASLAHRARSYLAVNCGQCHQAGGPTPVGWDARFELATEQMGLVDVVANNDGGNTGWRLVVPGNSAESILVHRMSATAGFSRMPNIGSYEIDAKGVDLVSAWILNLGAPVIGQQPRGGTISEGMDFTMSVVSLGNNLAYRWRKDGSDLGSTNAAHTIVNARLSSAGSYDVVITNSFGSVTSAVAVVSVIHSNTFPVITVQPQGVISPVGYFATLSVAAIGEAPLSYEWYRNGIPVSGATQSSLSRLNLQLSDAGNYTVVVSNTHGSVTSVPAHLDVVVPSLPVITVEPQDQAVVLGGSFTLTLGYSGSPPFSVAWVHNGTQVGNDSTLTVTNVSSLHVGGYQATVANTAGAAVSRTAAVSIHAPPSFTVEPLSQVVPAGINVDFTTSVSGTPPIYYSWSKDGVRLTSASASGPSIRLQNVVRPHSGAYRVVISNAVGTASSSNALLRVLMPQQLHAPALVDGKFRMNFGDAGGGRLGPIHLPYFEVQARDAFTNRWQILTNSLSLSNGIIYFEDPNIGQRSRRFYRVIEK